LLDINVLLALHWRPHVLHEAAILWSKQDNRKDWATCSITQIGFVRVLSNPSFDPSAPSPAKAAELLRASTETNRLHQFWSESIPVTAMTTGLRNRLRGHKQVTDAYLLALAMHHRGTFVTFDTRIRSLAPVGSEESRALVILQG
jgi:toxin-antitoxin system PIN domain toxin